jgi:hypothetical protein
MTEPKPTEPILSLETLNLLAEVLSNVTVQANNVDFDEVARKVGNARRELIAAIEAAS